MSWYNHLTLTGQLLCWCTCCQHTCWQMASLAMCCHDMPFMQMLRRLPSRPSTHCIEATLRKLHSSCRQQVTLSFVRLGVMGGSTGGSTSDWWCCLRTALYTATPTDLVPNTPSQVHNQLRMSHLSNHGPFVWLSCAYCKSLHSHRLSPAAPLLHRACWP